MIEATIENDSDIHLVIATSGAHARTMIVEFPDSDCVASAFKRSQIGAARSAAFSNCGHISSSGFTHLTGTVNVTGVGFWDEIHGQTGFAPNGIELNPVLRFAGTCSGGSGGGGGGGGGGSGGSCTAGYSPCLVYHGGADYDWYGSDGPTTRHQASCIR